MLTIEQQLDETMFFIQLEKEWREQNDHRDYVKELLWDWAPIPKQIKVMADEKTRKKIHYMENKWNLDPRYVDIREKMTTINLREVMEASWNTRFKLNMCSCHLPGHKDKTASCKYYPQTNTFYCFGCHRWGTLVDFIMHDKQLWVADAIKFVKWM